MKLNKYIFLITAFGAPVLLAQTDFVKWTAKTCSYEIRKENPEEKEVEISYSNAKVMSTARKIYKTVFSDLDGDNCPFNPSCSQFYVDAVAETNLLKGTLMFVDRFTRDLNYFKGYNNYMKDNVGKYYDPACNYTLDEKKIILNIPELPVR
jgi:putative component of membrane protein insertase Oxa1/YidC/SpoIIIJ protein YidD